MARQPEFAAADADGVFRPDVTVAVVVERDDRFLFVEERVRGELVVNQPAGHLEPGETLIEAAVRETLEETAWEVEPTALVAIYQWVAPHDGQQVLRFTFCGRALREHAGRALDAGIERALWLPAEALVGAAFRPRSPLVPRSVEDYRAGRRLPLDLLQAFDLGRGAPMSRA